MLYDTYTYRKVRMLQINKKQAMIVNSEILVNIKAHWWYIPHVCDLRKYGVYSARVNSVPNERPRDRHEVIKELTLVLSGVKCSLVRKLNVCMRCLSSMCRTFNTYAMIIRIVTLQSE